MRAITSARRATRSHLGHVVVGLLVLLAAACGSPAVGPAPASSASGEPVPVGPLAQQLTGDVTVAGALVHLQELQRIADANGGNRAAGTPGYEASVDYVAGVLRGAGFEVSTPSYTASDDGHGGSGGAGRNLVAQTRTGNPDAVVTIGAHLDSVPDGPGIVDNGSGVASLLEIAARLGARPEVQNTVRFAFFGDEENGAEGSTAYVENLPADDREKIKLYLNVDMVASPNAGYFAQGGEGRDEESAGPAGSATIGRVLAGELARTGVRAPEIIEFVGDDESPFIEAGIPVGGAENGDAEEKTAQQATDWGGQAGEAYDRCYHDACDRLDNVDRDVLDHYLRAMAGTLAYFATSTDELR